MNLKQFNPMKILNHLDVAKAIVRRENPYPVSFEIDPSNTCNHECTWCMYEDFMKEKQVIVPKEIFKSVIDEIIEIGIRSVTFTGGGEPLTHPLTIELMPYMRQRGVSIALVTNGGLLDSEKDRIIVENCSYIRISIDAGCEVTHTKLHRNKNIDKDNYQKIIDNIRYMVELKKKLKKDITIGTGYLVHPQNTQEIFAMVAKMKEIGANYVQIRPVCNLNQEEKELVIRESRSQIEHSLKMIDDDFHVFPILHRFNEIISMDRGYDICYGHALVGIIGADCNVYLCCQLKGDKRYILGNLKESSFKEIWNSQKRKDVIGSLDLSQCPPCRYNKYNEILDYLADEEMLHSEFL
ncbi:MAG: hypothetical protein A3C43_09455 [Candidatus Schekmanbacteria bacterium RIFCSPHIGHO2_02_FULL_38_11]|nr:MAG: hypothetical protein A3C43_09455 [Candidatus Schekmanbacteria bacterium RIFCSPHIGHO2_02_FULL_38_11]